MLTDRLQQQIQVAMRGGDNLRLSTLRLLYSALHNEQIAKMRKLSEEEEERAEAEILQEFLPKQMSEEEIGRIVDETVAQLDGSDFGRVMGIVMGKMKGQADGNTVARMVREKLKI